jgi:molybdate transport system substrate-binding protein
MPGNRETSGFRLAGRKDIIFLVLLVWGLLAWGLMGAVAAGCAAGEAPPSASQSNIAATGNIETITVFAAASLTDAFNDIAAAYESEHPGSEVVLNFDGSQRLRTQLEHGAHADVFASADWDQMAAVEELGLTADPPVNFASNRLVILEYTGSGGNLNADTLDSNPPPLSQFHKNLEALAGPDTKIVVGQPAAPIGGYTKRMLENMAGDPNLGPQLADDIRANIVSREASVRSVVQKVNLGEADAGVVYSSDARAVSARVSLLELPDSINVTADYPIAALTNTQGAARFVAFVLSAPGQQILRDYDFAPPPSMEGTAP